MRVGVAVVFAFLGLAGAGGRFVAAAEVWDGWPVVQVAGGEGFETRLRETLATVQPGTIVEMPEGRFTFQDEVIISQSHIVLRGQGAAGTVLSFKGQTAGAQGILGTRDAVVLEDFAVEDTAGDAIKVAGADGVVFRGLRVEWTRGPNTLNGGYGLYPVSSRNVLIEDCEISGASDSGIYVGQSENIVVRRNRPHHNVAGIEIENSRFADVRDNDVTANAAGILIFDLPELPKQGGKQTRVFDNHVYGNNFRNFSVPGNILHIIPKGTGIAVIANSDDEIFGNLIENHSLVSIAVVNFEASQHPFNDPNYNPRPERISIHDNRIRQHALAFFDGNALNTVANLLFGLRVPEIIYDGIGDGSYTGTPLPADRRICIGRNVDLRRGREASFGNMHLDHQRHGVPWPGGPVSRDLQDYACSYDPLPGAALGPFPPMPPAETPAPADVVQKLCAASGTGVNWAAALAVDCPELGSYRLFIDPSDPTTAPAEGGMPYELTTPLFTDEALKNRFVFLPPGTQARYAPTGVLDFPVGTVIAKTFSFPGQSAEQGPQLVETRLLIRRAGAWKALPYHWDSGHARLNLGGTVQTIEWLQGNSRRSIHYNAPGQAKCVFCHDATGSLAPIGPKAKFLNKAVSYADGARENQLARLQRLGRLLGLPEDPLTWPRVPVWDDPADGTLEQRARGYLEINCAHCHNPTGLARNTGFYLEYERDQDSTAYGTCKPPVAAGQGSGGRLDDVVPGRPDESVLVYRLSSDRISVRMPEEGRSIVHEEGLRLVRDWIQARPYKRCE